MDSTFPVLARTLFRDSPGFYLSPVLARIRPFLVLARILPFRVLAWNLPFFGTRSESILF